MAFAIRILCLQYSDNMDFGLVSSYMQTKTGQWNITYTYTFYNTIEYISMHAYYYPHKPNIILYII